MNQISRQQIVKEDISILTKFNNDFTHYSQSFFKKVNAVIYLCTKQYIKIWTFKGYEIWRGVVGQAVYFFLFTTTGRVIFDGFRSIFCGLYPPKNSYYFRRPTSQPPKISKMPPPKICHDYIQRSLTIWEKKNWKNAKKTTISATM